MLDFWDGESLLYGGVVLFRGACLVSWVLIVGFAYLYSSIKVVCSSMSVGGFNFTQKTLLCYIGMIGSDTYACVTNVFKR